MEEKSATVLSLPPDYTAQRRSSTEKKIQQIAEQVEGRNNLLILMHNDPDPDAISSARALEELMRLLSPTTRITLGHGGIIGRAENLTMADLIIPHGVRIPLDSAAEKISEYDGVMLVDTQPNAANHLLLNTDYPRENVLLAIDHHPPRRSQMRAMVHDVRPEVGASATILCEYLAVAAVPVDAQLATALFYGIKADTLGLSRHTSDMDIWAYSTLRHLIETDLLNCIEHVQLPRTYYRSISDALANTTIYSARLRVTGNGENDLDETDESLDAGKPDDAPDAPDQVNDYRSDLQRFELDVIELSRMLASDQTNDFRSDSDPDETAESTENGDGPDPDPEQIGDIAISLLFDVERPDMAAEVADLLMRMENVSWSICLAIYRDRAVISVRTDNVDARAGRLVRSIVGRNGAAGGHHTMAGGRILLPNKTPAERIAELHALVPRFLNELGAGDDVGVPLLEAK